MPVVYSYETSNGKRKKSDDAVIVVKNKDGNILSVVCDGIGSHKSSSYSSNFLIKEFSKYWKTTKFLNFNELKENIVNKLIEYNNILVNKSKLEKISMGTTIVITIIYEDNLLVINVGDSRAYAIDYSDNILLLSRDDSYVNELLQAGGITKEEAKKHPKRNVLTQAIAIDLNFSPHIFEFKINEFNYVLSCTDGLSNILEEEEIRDIIINKNLTDSTKKLINLTKEKGGKDDISLSIFKIIKGEK